MSLTPAQLEVRRTRIGSSETGAILGIDPYKSALDVFTSKTTSPSDNPKAHQDWGLDLEPAILVHHARRRRYVLLGSPGTVTHPTLPLCATPDALASADGDPSVTSCVDIQAKNDQGHGQLEWGEPETDAAPLIYVAQVTVELGVLRAAHHDVTHGEIAVSIRGAPPVFYRVDFDENLFGDVAEICAKWKRDHLDTGIPPEGSPDATAEYIRRRYAKHDENLLDPTPELIAMVTEVSYLRQQSKALESEQRAAENRLKAAIGERAGVAGLCTWRLQKRAGHTVKESEHRVLRLLAQKEG